jgi:hypothetical protein
MKEYPKFPPPTNEGHHQFLEGFNNNNPPPQQQPPPKCVNPNTELTPMEKRDIGDDDVNCFSFVTNYVIPLAVVVVLLMYIYSEWPNVYSFIKKFLPF